MSKHGLTRHHYELLSTGAIRCQVCGGWVPAVERFQGVIEFAGLPAQFFEGHERCVLGLHAFALSLEEKTTEPMAPAIDPAGRW